MLLFSINVRKWEKRVIASVHCKHQGCKRLSSKRDGDCPAVGGHREGFSSEIGVKKRPGVLWEGTTCVLLQLCFYWEQVSQEKEEKCRERELKLCGCWKQAPPEAALQASDRKAVLCRVDVAQVLWLLCC